MITGGRKVIKIKKYLDEKVTTGKKNPKGQKQIKKLKAILPLQHWVTETSTMKAAIRKGQKKKKPDMVRKDSVGKTRILPHGEQ